MDGTSSPDPPTAPFESGVPRLVLKSVVLSAGTIRWCYQLLTLPMGATIFISGSQDRTIRMWDAEIGAAVGKPLKGHSDWVLSVAYSPDGGHIISGSDDRTIRVWDAEIHTGAGKPLGEQTSSVQSIANSDGKPIVSGSYHNTTRLLDSFPYPSIRASSCNPIYPNFCAKPDKDGWVKDSKRGLLYWVPHDCRECLHSPVVLTIPLTSRNRSVSLDFDDFAFGTSWSQIFESASETGAGGPRTKEMVYR